MTKLFETKWEYEWPRLFKYRIRYDKNRFKIIEIR